MLKSVRPQMVNGDALHAVLVRLHAHTQASTHTHTRARAPQFYLIRTLLLFLSSMFM